MSDDAKKLTDLFASILGVKPDVVAAKPNTYLVRYFCDNCRRGSTIRFKKEQAAPDGGLKCPNCGLRHTRKLTGA